MGYFPNMTAWEFWAEDNCFKCAHWPRTDDCEPCAVEMAHNLYNYEAEEGTSLCNVLDMLIPRTKDGLGCKRCAMFKDRDGLTEKHLRDWEKYKAIMAERDAA
jgi:hypothetical protein